MAASIFRLSLVSCSRVKLCNTGISRCLVQSKRSLLPSASVLPVTRNKLFHTTPPSEKERQVFELPKNTKEGYLHWKNERVVSVLLLGMIPAAAVYPNIVLDHGFAVLAPLHMYWGVNAILGDYIPMVLPKAITPIMLPAIKMIWLGMCVGSVLGLLYINVNDVGVTKLFSQIMTL